MVLCLALRCVIVCHMKWHMWCVEHRIKKNWCMQCAMCGGMIGIYCGACMVSRVVDPEVQPIASNWSTMLLYGMPSKMWLHGWSPLSQHTCKNLMKHAWYARIVLEVFLARKFLITFCTLLDVRGSHIRSSRGGKVQE